MDARPPEHKPNVIVQRIVMPTPNETTEGVQADRHPLHRDTDATRIRVGEAVWGNGSGGFWDLLTAFLSYG